MKTQKLMLFLAALGVVVLAGLVSLDAKADDVTPEEDCKAAIDDLVEAGIDMGSFWEEDLNECWVRTSVEGSSCYPGYEVWYVQYITVGSSTYWDWESYGCVARYNRPTDVIKDPSYGFHYINKTAAGTFEYEPRTCSVKCRIAVHSLTLHATEMLEEAPGRVLGKAFIQIYDEFGNAGLGDFTFCLPAKGAKSPTFFRLGAYQQWYPVTNGHWELNLYCMQGEMSGNYILVDAAYNPK